MKQVFQKSSRIPTDQAGVFEVLSTDQKLALVTPANPPPGISGFLLDVVDEDTVELSSDVTDHYTERNTAIQDHVALRPETVTLHGVVSELSVLRVPEAAPETSVRNSLPDNSDLSPELTEGAVQNKRDATPPTQATASPFAKYENAYGKIGAQVGRKQADVYSYFYQLWKGRQFVTVETAWGTWPMMVLQTLRAEQPADSRFKSEFYATFKAIRFASDITVSVKPMESVAANQAADITPNGKVGQKSESLLRKAMTYNPLD